MRGFQEDPQYRCDAMAAREVRNPEPNVALDFLLVFYYYLHPTITCITHTGFAWCVHNEYCTIKSVESWSHKAISNSILSESRVQVGGIDKLGFFH